jgi:hypothetical protein
LVNSEVIIRTLLEVNFNECSVYVVCTSDHAKALIDLLPLELSTLINWIYIRESLNSYSLSAISKTASIISQFLEFDTFYIFLSTGTSDLYASLFVRFLKSRKKQGIRFGYILHGVLSNLEPRDNRPDPFIYRNGRRVKMSFSRFFLSFPTALRIVIRKDPDSSFYVLGRWIKENLIKRIQISPDRVKVFIFPTPIMKIDRQRKFQTPNSLLILGYNNLGMLRRFCEEIQNNGAHITLNIVSGSKRYSSISNYNFVNIYSDTSRSNVIAIASRCNYLVLFRNRELSKLQTSGVLLESISLGIPIIFPIWMQVMTEQNSSFPGKTYSSLEELLALLIWNANETSDAYTGVVKQLSDFQQFVHKCCRTAAT